MRKKIFQKLKKFLCYFFICFSLNFRGVKATENNITCQTTTIRCPGSMFERRLFRIRNNKNQKKSSTNVEDFFYNRVIKLLSKLPIELVF